MRCEACGRASELVFDTGVDAKLCQSCAGVLELCRDTTVLWTLIKLLKGTYIACPHGCGLRQARGPMGLHKQACLAPFTLERLFEVGKVDTTDPVACWIWNGRRKKVAGWEYGKTVLGPAHRVSFEFAKRGLKPGEVVRHSCDNPPCVNPAHLDAGTTADNIADAVARKRLVRGPRGRYLPLQS